MPNIDERLIDADDEMKITEDFNRILTLLDDKIKELSDRCTALEERVTALEPEDETEPQAEPGEG